MFGSYGEFTPALCQNELMYSDFTAAILIFFPTLQFLMTKVVLDVESRRDRVGLKIIRHFISNKTQKDLNQNKYVPVVILKTYNAPLLDFNYCMKE